MTSQQYSDLLGPFAYGAGFQQVLLPAQPAAGAEFVTKVPGGVAYRILSARIALVTSVAVANRIPRIAIRDGDGNDIMEVQAVTAVPAGTNTYQFFMPGIDTSSSRQAAGIPSMFLHPGYSIVLGATNIQAADQISGVRIWTEQFELGNGAYSISGVPTPEGF